MIKGALAKLQENRKKPEVVQYYNFLQNLITDLALFQILPYDAAAEAAYQAFVPAIKRIGLADCRIAASALSRSPEFTVVSRNLSDFGAIGAKCENWIDPPST
jgi:predicted nucleic acid-binding protein